MPDARARENDVALADAGRPVWDFDQLDLPTAWGISVRKFLLERGPGQCSTGVPSGSPVHIRPLPLLHQASAT